MGLLCRGGEGYLFELAGECLAVGSGELQVSEGVDTLYGGKYGSVVIIEEVFLAEVQ